MRVLLIRYGAYGDCMLITPIVEKLASMGHEIVLNISERGSEIFEHNPHIKKLILHKKDSVAPTKEALENHWKRVAYDCKADKTVNFTGSIENSLMFHPADPEYNFPKWERFTMGNVNSYDHTIRWAEHSLGFSLTGCEKHPFFYFTEAENKKAQEIIRKNKYNIIWALSGSGASKTYPWTTYLWGELFNKHKDIHIISVGGSREVLLQRSEDQITPLAGIENIRMAICLMQYAELVVAPDTGLLHASGAFPIPKIGILGAVSKRHITHYFDNDYSLEAECTCAPCFHLIYDHSIQCPVEIVTGGCWCMAEGQKPERLYAQIIRIKEGYGSNKPQ